MNQPKNIKFDKVKLSGWTLHVNSAFPASGLEELLTTEDFDGVRGPFEEIEASKFARVYKGAISFSGHVHNLFIKQFLYRSKVDFLKHIFRPCRAVRALKAFKMLAEENILSPEVIAMGEKRVGLFVAKSFLITRSVENSLPLWQWIAKSTDLKAKRKLIGQLGETIGKMHASNISHGDLRTGNVLVKEKENGWEFYLLDNERTVKYNKLPDKLRFKNLVQINMIIEEKLTNTDRMRFYKAYLLQNSKAIPNPKEFAKQVSKRTAERLSKKC